MTVEELITKLQNIDKDRQVFLSKDAEGRSYSPLCSLEVAAYRPLTYTVEIGLETLTDEDREMGYEEADLVQDGHPALLLFPIS